MRIARRLSLVAFLFCAGCGRGLPRTAPVSGTITLDGKPLAGVAVSFVNATAPRFGIATTDAAGRYVLTTFTAGDGAVVGEHKVVILCSPRAVLPTDQQGLPTPDAYKMLAKANAAATKSPTVPLTYASAEKTPLRAIVKAGPNQFDFDLGTE